MIQLSGIFSESLGGTCTIRGYAKYNEIVELSYPHPGYQRPAEDEHVAEISSFITSGSNSFSPEVVLAYTAKYNYYAQGASSEVDAFASMSILMSINLELFCEGERKSESTQLLI